MIASPSSPRRTREILRGGAAPEGADKRAFRLMAVQHGLFAMLPLMMSLAALVMVVREHSLGIDFHRQYWVAGHRLLHGLSPYDPSWQHLTHGIGFPYAAFDAIAFAPFGALPQGVATVLFCTLDLAAIMLTARLMGVRDWRIYGVLLVWPPVFSAWQSGNVTALLALGIALLWRHRDNRIAAGGLMALLVTVKLFVWPLAIWLLATRRYAQLGWAAVFGLALNVTSWWVVGFDDFARYRSLVSQVATMDEHRAFSVLALGLHGGASRGVASAIAILVAGCVATLAIRLGRRGRDRDAFVIAIAVALMAAPVIWLHYFALLVIPLAMARPRLSLLWFVPWISVLCPVTDAASWQVILMLALVATVVVSTVRTTTPEESEPERLVADRSPAPFAASAPTYGTV